MHSMFLTKSNTELAKLYNKYINAKYNCFSYLLQKTVIYNKTKILIY